MALGGGEDQEAGEDVAGAALARDDAVVPGRLQWHRVSNLQVQDRRAGRDQETFGCVAHHLVTFAALHQPQTHLEEDNRRSEERRCQSFSVDTSESYSWFLNLIQDM